MMGFRFLLVTLCFYISAVSMSAQTYHSTMTGNDHHWQSNSNPAFAIDGSIDSFQIKIALPSIFFGAASNIRVSDYIQSNGTRSIFNPRALITSSDEINQLRLGADIQTLAVAVELNKLTLSLGHNIKSQALLAYPVALLDVLANGNAAYIGENLDLDFNIFGQTYHQVSFGAAYQINDKISVGTRLKYINGIQNITTNRGRVSVYTNPEYYQLEFDNDIDIQSTNTLEYSSLSDISLINASSQYGQVFGANSGIVLDIGATYQLDIKTQIAISASNLGKINWRDNSQRFTSDESYTYDGVDAFPILLNDGDLAISDTLSNILRINETEGLDYSSHIPSTIELSILHQLNYQTELQGVIRVTDYNYGNELAIGLVGRREIGKYIRLGLSGVYTTEQAINLGLSAQFRLGPVQMNLATDNVLAMMQDRFYNGYLGLSIAF